MTKSSPNSWRVLKKITDSHAVWLAAESGGGEVSKAVRRKGWVAPSLCGSLGVTRNNSIGYAARFEFRSDIVLDVLLHPAFGP